MSNNRDLADLGKSAEAINLDASAPADSVKIDSTGRMLVGSQAIDNRSNGANEGTIVAGDNRASKGGVALQVPYGSDDSAVNFGSRYSSGDVFIGKAVRSSTSSGAFESTADNVAWDRGALIVGDDLTFYNASNDSTAKGSEVTMTEQFKIDESGRVTMPNQPSFHAGRDSGYLTAGNVFVCNDVLHNIGSHYNNSNGRFTAPVQGSYQFNVNYLGQNNSVQNELHLRKNGNAIIYSRDETQNNRYHSMSYSVVLFLNTNDYIDLYVDNGAIYGSSENWSNFSGYLIG